MAGDNTIKFEIVAPNAPSSGGGSGGVGSSSQRGGTAANQGGRVEDASGMDSGDGRRNRAQESALSRVAKMGDARRQAYWNDMAQYGKGVNAVRMAGSGVQNAAGVASQLGLPTGGLASAAGGFARAAGPAGIALAVAMGIKQGFDFVQQNATRFAETAKAYSPEVAVASGMARAEQIQGDLRRSQKLGPELANFVTAQSRFNQAKEDLLAAVIKPLIPMVTFITECLTKIVEGLTHYIEWATNELADMLNPILAGMEAALNALPGVEVSLGRIAKNTTPKQQTVTQHLADLLNLRAPTVDEKQFKQDREWAAAGVVGIGAFAGV